MQVAPFERLLSVRIRLAIEKSHTKLQKWCPSTIPDSNSRMISVGC